MMISPASLAALSATSISLVKWLDRSNVLPLKLLLASFYFQAIGVRAPTNGLELKTKTAGKEKIENEAAKLLIMSD